MNRGTEEGVLEDVVPGVDGGIEEGVEKGKDGGMDGIRCILERGSDAWGEGKDAGIETCFCWRRECDDWDGWREGCRYRNGCVL